MARPPLARDLRARPGSTLGRCALALLLAACGDPPAVEAPPEAAAVSVPTGAPTGDATCADLSGDWSLTEVIDRSGCGEPPETLTFTARWSQDGCAGELSVPGTGIRLPGRVEGQTLYAEGSYRQLGEIQKAVVLTRAGDAVTGAATWRWELAGEIGCEGTSTFEGARDQR